MEGLQLNPHIQHHLDATHRNLERMQGHVAQADAKAYIALTFQGGVVAGFAIFAVALKDQIRDLPEALRLLTILFVALFLLTFLLSGWKLFEAISPRVHGLQVSEGPSALFFFGTVAGMETQAFMDRMNELDPEEIHEGVLRTTQAVARIAAQKYRNLRTAFFFMGIEMLFFVLASLPIVL
jgi:hypothetical protein